MNHGCLSMGRVSLCYSTLGVKIFRRKPLSVTSDGDEKQGEDAGMAVVDEEAFSSEPLGTECTQWDELVDVTGAWEYAYLIPGRKCLSLKEDLDCVLWIAEEAEPRRRYFETNKCKLYATKFLPRELVEASVRARQQYMVFAHDNSCLQWWSQEKTALRHLQIESLEDFKTRFREQVVGYWTTSAGGGYSSLFGAGPRLERVARNVEIEEVVPRNSLRDAERNLVLRRVGDGDDAVDVPDVRDLLLRHSFFADVLTRADEVDVSANTEQGGSGTIISPVGDVVSSDDVSGSWLELARALVSGDDGQGLEDALEVHARCHPNAFHQPQVRQGFFGVLQLFFEVEGRYHVILSCPAGTGASICGVGFKEMFSGRQLRLSLSHYWRPDFDFATLHKSDKVLRIDEPEEQMSVS